MSPDDFSAVLDVNLSGAFRVARAALKIMSRQRGGHIVFIGSFSALSGPAGQPNYAAAKAGLIGLTQSLAREYGARNIRVNCVLPGFLETRMTARLGDELRAQVPQARTRWDDSTPPPKPRVSSASSIGKCRTPPARSFLSTAGRTAGRERNGAWY